MQFSLINGGLCAAGVVRGLLPVAATSVGGGLGYAFKWVKICSLAEASSNGPLFPIVVDEAKVRQAPLYPSWPAHPDIFLHVSSNTSSLLIHHSPSSVAGLVSR